MLEQSRRNSGARTLLVLVVALALAAAGGIALSNRLSAQAEPVRAVELRGLLPNQFDRHYLGLQPQGRDTIVVLTLAFEPQDNPLLREAVNFSVLTEDGLRRFLAGADFREVSISGGSPLQFDPVGNKMQAAFLAPGEGSYTVIVYNNAAVPASYSLTVQGGLLLDDAGQTQAAITADNVRGEQGAANEGDRAAELSAGEATTPTETVEIQSTGTATVETETAATETVAADTGETQPAAQQVQSGPTQARRLSGELAFQYARHYLVLEPSERDGRMVLTLTYEPMDSAELAGGLNFWVLTEDGVRRLVRGEPAKELNLATGSLPPFAEYPNIRWAEFRATGLGPYTVVVYNDTTIPGQYALTVEGGLLIDGYGQTNETRAAAAEIAASTPAASESTTPAPAQEVAIGEPVEPETADAELIPVSNTTATTGASEATDAITETAATETPADPSRGALQLGGALPEANTHHYLELHPDFPGARVILTLNYEPAYAQELTGKLNFWVLTEDGVRRVVNGERPSDLNIATGQRVQFGPEQGSLQAAFNSSGERYTVIVYNDSTLSATYRLSVRGGVLIDTSGTTDAVAALP